MDFLGGVNFLCCFIRNLPSSPSPWYFLRTGGLNDCFLTLNFSEGGDSIEKADTAYTKKAPRLKEALN